MSFLDGGAAKLGLDLAPVLLDEYTPDGALVIHSGTSGRVWVGSGSSVGPSNGTPLDPSSSLTVGAGATWAVLDSSATAPVPLYLSSKATSWQASPAVIAAQTAAQLLKTGVPNVLTGARIYAGGIVPTAPIDVSAYASTVISINATWLSTPGLLEFDWTDEDGNALGSKLVQIGVAGLARLPLTVSLNVYGPRLSVTYSGTLKAGVGTPPMSIYGSNRATVDALGPAPASRVLTTGLVNIAAGASTNFLDTASGNPSNTVGSGVMRVRGGRYWCRMLISSTSIIGQVQYGGIDITNGPTNVVIQDTSNIPANSLSKYWEQLLPAGVLQFSFLTAVTGNQKVGLELTPCDF